MDCYALAKFDSAIVEPSICDADTGYSRLKGFNYNPGKSGMVLSSSVGSNNDISIVHSSLVVLTAKAGANYFNFGVIIPISGRIVSMPAGEYTLSVHWIKNFPGNSGCSSRTFPIAFTIRSLPFS